MGNRRKTGTTAVAADYGSDRKHLTGREVEKLIEATTGNLYEVRDRCLLLLMFRHGLRVSEACGLKLDQVDTESRVLHVTRLRRGLSTTHSLRADELRAISAWLKERPDEADRQGVFCQQAAQGVAPLDRQFTFAEIQRRRSLPLRTHPHMLRQACGFALADQGADTRLIQDYLGHRKIEHTVKYTPTNPARFERIWR